MISTTLIVEKTLFGVHAQVLYIWGCPINVVLKVILKTKNRPVGNKVQNNSIGVYKNVLIETK